MKESDLKHGQKEVATNVNLIRIISVNEPWVFENNTEITKLQMCTFNATIIHRASMYNNKNNHNCNDDVCLTNMAINNVFHSYFYALPSSVHHPTASLSTISNPHTSSEERSLSFETIVPPWFTKQNLLLLLLRELMDHGFEVDAAGVLFSSFRTHPKLRTVKYGLGLLQKYLQQDIM